MNDLPKSPPAQISAELRRQLQRRFDQARSLVHSDPPEFPHALSLIRQIMAVDPGNILYIDLLLAAIRRRDASRPAGLWRKLWKRTPLNAAAALARAVKARDWPAALQLTPDAISVTGIDHQTLADAAAACAGAQLDAAELRYRLAAVNERPGATDPTRQLAEALERMGRFDDARDWRAKLADRTSLTSDQATVELREQSWEQLLANAATSIETGDFDQARQSLEQATAQGGGDLRIREAWDSLTLRQSEHRLAEGRKQALEQPGDKAAAVVAQLVADHERLELAIAHSRAERFPGDVELQLELVRKLKRARNFSGALARLAELEARGQLPAVALIERGECWQHLRQFPKAIDCFRAAAERSRASPGDETSLLARYRGAVLAEALGRQTEACSWLREILSVVSDYKDTRQRLDKLQPICDKTGFSGGE